MRKIYSCYWVDFLVGLLVEKYLWMYERIVVS